MKTIALIVACFCTQLACADSYDPVKVGITGVSMFAGSIALSNSNVPWNKATELQGWSFCWTTMGFKFFGKEYGWLSPICVGAFDLMYRIPQFHENEDMAFRKLACDLSGVLGACIVEIDLHPDVKLTVSGTSAQATLKF